MDGATNHQWRQYLCSIDVDAIKMGGIILPLSWAVIGDMVRSRSIGDRSAFQTKPERLLEDTSRSLLRGTRLAMGDHGRR